MSAPRILTRHALALELGLDRNRLTRILAGIEPDGQVSGRYPGWTIARVIDRLTTSRGGDEDPDTLTPRERLHTIQANRLDLEITRRAQALLPTAEFHREHRILAENLAEVLLDLPARMQVDGFPPKMVDFARLHVARAQSIVDDLPTPTHDDDAALGAVERLKT